MSKGPESSRFNSRRSTVYSTNGMVATSQPLAAEAGIGILRNGGNAFDAAVATAAALNVVEPNMTGIGGDVFALYRTADGEVGAMRSCGAAPETATIENVRSAIARDRGISPQEAEMPLRGPYTVTVPGTAKGWEATLSELGTLSFEETLRPAIEYAAEGFPVSEVVVEQWQHGDKIFSDKNAREAYLVDDEPPKTGDLVTFPDLAESMRAIADDGAAVVYEGDIGKAIVEEVQSKGGFLTLDDLRSHQVEWPDPISATYNGAEVYQLPPNNQGLIVLEALKIAERIGTNEYDYDTTDRVHFLAEAMKRAFVDGHHYITDPEYESVPDLLSEEYIERRSEKIDRRATAAEIGVPDAGAAENGDTVLLCVADSEGNLVSYINSRFHGFGSGLVAGETGIALQNRGSSFSLNTDHPNCLEPGKKPFHTLIPAITRFDQDDWAAFGVMGGYMQPQGQLQVLTNILDYEMSLQRALDEPRWRYLEGGDLGVESRVDDDTLSELDRRGHSVRTLHSNSFGGAQIVRNNDGILSGATDPRKDGVAIGF